MAEMQFVSDAPAGDKFETRVDAYSFPGPFTTISSPYALSHKTKTAIIAPKARTMDLLSILRNWAPLLP